MYQGLKTSDIDTLSTISETNPLAKYQDEGTCTYRKRINFRGFKISWIDQEHDKY